MYPEGNGGDGLVFFDWDFQDQNHNWSGNSRAPAGDNGDLGIKTHFFTAGLQYMFVRDLGLQIEVPYVERSFTSLGGPSGTQAVTRRWSDLGDVRINGLYTGIIRDQSLGVSIGLKLPTGDFKHQEPGIGVDRDTQIGTGSTDLLLGVFYHHWITKDRNWWIFAQAQLDSPMCTQDGYCPGIEGAAALGFYYNGWSIGNAKIRPIAQAIASQRGHDSGPHSAHPVASGYERVLLSPGIEIDFHHVMIDASIELPVYQHVSGDQLISQALFKAGVTYRF